MVTTRTNVEKIGVESNLVIYEAKVIIPENAIGIRLYAVSGGHSERNPSDPPSGVFESYVMILEGIPDTFKRVAEGRSFHDPEPGVNSAILRMWKNGVEIAPKHDKNFENYYLMFDENEDAPPQGSVLSWKVGSSNFLAKETKFLAFIEITTG